MSRWCPNLYAPQSGLLKKVDELELSLRSPIASRTTTSCTSAILSRRAKPRCWRTPNLGPRSLDEIKEVLAQMGLHLGMEVPGWPPDNINELAKRFEDHY